MISTPSTTLVETILLGVPTLLYIDNEKLIAHEDLMSIFKIAKDSEDLAIEINNVDSAGKEIDLLNERGILLFDPNKPALSNLNHYIDDIIAK